MKSQSARVRSRTGVTRSIRRGALLAVLASLAVVPAAQAVTYPVSGGNGFTAGLENWAGTAASCSPNLLCTEQNFWSGTEGNPPGSLESRLDIYANAGDLYQGQATWQSPPFVATASGAGVLNYDRQVTSDGLATLNPASGIEPVLIDETNGQQTSLGTGSLSAANAAFVRRSVAVPEDTLIPGHTYRLEMRSATATSSVQAGLTGSISLRIDNVALVIGNSGPGGASGSDGVKFTGPPLSQKQAEHLLSRFNWAADTGHRPGGSVLPLAQCTIVGTPHADRIRGSSGNDVICGLGGRDKINGRGGLDIIDTGSGSDRVTASGGGDAVAGLGGGDRLFGNTAGDKLGGGAGKDRLAGGSGRDRIDGGSGRDRVVGAHHDRIAKVERRG